MSGGGIKHLRGIRWSASKTYGADWNLSREEESVTDEEDLDDWPGVDEATEVIRAYGRDSKLKPRDAHMKG